METHRTLHDFGELTYQDVTEINSKTAARPVKNRIRAQLYSSLAAALAVGVIIGYLTRRN